MLMKLTAILAVGAALTLGGCAVDSQMSYVSYLPDFLKQALPVLAKHGWETCVKANVMGATGKPLGERTYLVNIDDNQIGDRRDGADRCAKETYRPL